MMYDAVVQTEKDKHTYKNIEAEDENDLTQRLARDVDGEITSIHIEETFENWRDKK